MRSERQMDTGRLHPVAREVLLRHARVPFTQTTLEAARQGMIDATPGDVGRGPDLESVVDFEIDGVPVRLYRPQSSEPLPCILYVHGGGWVTGRIETHDGLLRALAAESGWAVLAVEYRLAPEATFPAQLDDLGTALAWVQSDAAAARGIDSRRIAVGGDSAGANMAVVTARRARDAGRGLAAQLLICPTLDPDAEYPDLDEYGLHRDEMTLFWGAYAPPDVDRATPDINPFLADLAGMPPAVIVTAELDIMHVEGERYGSLLMRAGVPVISARYQGMPHNFVRKLARFDVAHAALAQIATALRLWGSAGTGSAA